MAKPTQSRMFATSDLPLFSMTAPRTHDSTFTEREPEPEQLPLPDTQPSRMVHIDTINGMPSVLFGAGLEFRAYHNPTTASLARVTNLIDSAPEIRTDQSKYSTCYLGIYPPKN